jgi:ribosomal protein S18 acetylase RimI-like enzyme
VSAAAVTIRPFADADEQVVVELWARCGLVRPWNDPHDDIARKRRVQAELFLVAVADGGAGAGATIAGTVMAGYDGHRGWINYLATDPARRRQGIARALMQAAEAGLARLGCPKINLQIRHDNRDAIAFYQHIGFGNDAVVSMGKRLPRD